MVASAALGPSAAFEFGQAGGFGADAHRGLDKRDTALKSEFSEIVSRRHRLGWTRRWNASRVIARLSHRRTSVFDFPFACKRAA